MPQVPKIRMTGHVPIRFPQAMIDQVKIEAHSDGLTVSSWIRMRVRTELERRLMQQRTDDEFLDDSPDWTEFDEMMFQQTENIYDEQSYLPARSYDRPW